MKRIFFASLVACQLSALGLSSSNGKQWNKSSDRYQYAQNLQIQHTNEQFSIQSKVLKEERTILVRVPADYQKGTEKYPVVYLLDGQGYRTFLMAGIIENLFDSHLMPEVILVSIPNTIRPRDMTPSVSARMAESGGADNFIKFFETELFAEIEKRYRIQPHRTLVGHSLSGLFASYVVLARPELFNAYLLASPHLQWDSNYVSRRGRELFRSKADLNRTLFVAIGDEPDYMSGLNAYKEMLKGLELKNFDVEFHQLAGENHSSTNIDVFNKGLRKVWADWKMPQPIAGKEMSLADLENHYKAATIKYGYELSIPESSLINLGDRFLKNGKTNDAIKVFERAVNSYPNSANAFYVLAAALEQNGQLREAKQHYEQALHAAEKAQLSTRIINRIKDDIKRLSGS